MSIIDTAVSVARSKSAALRQQASEANSSADKYDSMAASLEQALSPETKDLLESLIAEISPTSQTSENVSVVSSEGS